MIDAMSDKNPSYSIPKALGEPAEELDALASSALAVEFEKFREQMERKIFDAFCLPVRQHKAIAVRGGRIVTVDLDDVGKPIERCRKCGPVLLCSECMSKVT